MRGMLLRNCTFCYPECYDVRELALGLHARLYTIAMYYYYPSIIASYSDPGF